MVYKGMFEKHIKFYKAKAKREGRIIVNLQFLNEVQKETIKENPTLFFVHWDIKLGKIKQLKEFQNEKEKEKI